MAAQAGFCELLLPKKESWLLETGLLEIQEPVVKPGLMSMAKGLLLVRMLGRKICSLTPGSSCVFQQCAAQDESAAAFLIILVLMIWHLASQTLPDRRRGRAETFWTVYRVLLNSYEAHST